MSSWGRVRNEGAFLFKSRDLNSSPDGRTGDHSLPQLADSGLSPRAGLAEALSPPRVDPCLSPGLAWLRPCQPLPSLGPH